MILGIEFKGGDSNNDENVTIHSDENKILHMPSMFPHISRQKEKRKDNTMSHFIEPKLAQRKQQSPQPAEYAVFQCGFASDKMTLLHMVA